MFRDYKGLSSLAGAVNKIQNKVSVLDSAQYKTAAEVGDFERKLEGYLSEVKSKFRDNMSLTDEVIKIATRDSLTDDEIDRVCQALNMKTYQDQFEKTVGKDDRSVRFPIASPEKVKAAVRGPVKEEGEKAASEMDGEMEKSAGGKDLVSRIINYNPEGRDRIYSKPLLPNARTEFLLDKIAKNLREDIEKAAALQREIDEGVETVSICFSKYASDARGLDFQGAFDRMSYRAGLRRGTQMKIRDQFDKVKGYHKIASDVTLNLINIDEVEDFSLGNHSISKIAEEPVASLPEVVDKKRDVKDFEKLVQIALKIQENDKMLDTINSNIESKRQIVNANEEFIEEDKAKKEELK